MSADNQLYSDPKTIQLMKLVNMVDAAGWALMRNDGTAILIISSIIAEIEIEEADNTKQLQALQRELVDNYECYMPTLNVGDDRRIFYMLCQYLNRTYFKEFRAMRFQNPKGGAFRVNPS
jgi:hypothetical protein